MRKFLVVVWLLLLANAAQAQIVGQLPFQLQNDTVADASQVMANYNAIVTGVNANAAKNGVNADITQLSALSTPLTRAQGGTSAYIATAVGTGSANAQVVAATAPAYVLTPGSNVQFFPGFTNTGPTTLAVGTSGAIAVFRQTPYGVTALAGGELVVGSSAIVIYDGIRYQLVIDQSSSVPTGAVFSTIVAAAPPGYLLLQGQAVSCTTYALLASLMGVTPCSTFILPDARGRYLASPDAGAGRLQLCGASGTLQTTCGSQLLAQTALPNVQLSTSAPSATVGGQPAFALPSTAATTVPGGTTGSPAYTIDNFAALTIGGGTTSSINGGVAQTALYPPTIVLNAMIKY